MWSRPPRPAFRVTGAAGRVLDTTRDPDAAQLRRRRRRPTVAALPEPRLAPARGAQRYPARRPPRCRQRVLASTGRVALAVALVGAADPRCGGTGSRSPTSSSTWPAHLREHPIANTFKALHLAVSSAARLHRLGVHQPGGLPAGHVGSIPQRPSPGSGSRLRLHPRPSSSRTCPPGGAAPAHAFPQGRSRLTTCSTTSSAAGRRLLPAAHRPPPAHRHRLRRRASGGSFRRRALPVGPPGSHLLGTGDAPSWQGLTAPPTCGPRAPVGVAAAEAVLRRVAHADPDAAVTWWTRWLASTATSSPICRGR